MLPTLTLLPLLSILVLVTAAPSIPNELQKRTPRQSFVGCSPASQGGDTLVTPPFPDGCAYGYAMRGGGYNHAYSYYQPSSDTCVCSQSPPESSDYTSPCTETDWTIYSLTTEFSFTGCRASINGTPSTGVNVPYLPWCFNYCADSNHMFFTPTTGGIFNCYCDDEDFGEGEAECPGAIDASYGEGPGYYYTK